MRKLDVKSGEKYARLEIIKETDTRIESGMERRYFLCKCICGVECVKSLQRMRNGHTKSCGCLKDTPKSDIDRALRKLYRGIIERCKESDVRRKNYFDKGIGVCPEWREDRSLFIEWCLNNGYKKELQIDRRDNSKGYSPDNCRFVTGKVNMNNRDLTIFVEYRGKRYAFTDLLTEKGLRGNESTIRERRRRGMSVEDAFDTPIKKVVYFIEYKGERYTFMDLLRKKGLIENETAIRDRLKAGWTVEDSFDKPIEPRKRKPQ